MIPSQRSHLDSSFAPIIINMVAGRLFHLKVNICNDEEFAETDVLFFLEGQSHFSLLQNEFISQVPAWKGSCLNYNMMNVCVFTFLGI